MTIASTTRTAGPFIGNDSTTEFPFTFRVFDEEEIVVVRLDDATQVETTLVLVTDYTVDLNASQETNPGGTITLVAGALATGYTLVITSEVEALQPVDLVNMGGFYPEVIEDALDRATVQIQQLTEKVGRAVKMPITGLMTYDELVASINTAAAIAQAACAEAIAIITEAAEIAQESYESFRDRYIGIHSTDPIVDGNGGPLTGGELYFNSESSSLRVFMGSGWFDTGITVNIGYLQAWSVSDPKMAFDTDGTEAVYPVVTDDGPPFRVLLGVDRVGKIFGKGLVSENYLGEHGQHLLEVDGVVGEDVVPLLVDIENRVLLGYSMPAGRIVGLGITAPRPVGGDRQLPAHLDPGSAEYHHVLVYGEGVATGEETASAISTSQPLSHLTFQGGPRAAGASYTPFKALVEDTSAAPDGSTNPGETPCAGLANYAGELAILESGVAPADHVIVASAPGHTGYTIAQLSADPGWYATGFTAHVSQAVAIAAAAGKTYRCPLVGWVQGESDVTATTAYATYLAALLALRQAIEDTVQDEAGVGTPTLMAVAQTSYNITSHNEVALAQLAACLADDGMLFATPMYHLPYSDGVHLTAAGSKWLGAYLGKAYAASVLGKAHHRCLRPLGAVYRGGELRIRFDVPVRPLVIDTTNLATTTDYGFTAEDAGGPIGVVTVWIEDEDTIVIELDDTPGASAVIRYALENLGSGLTITGGASGNLRDSDPRFVVIGGSEYPLWNVAPHFEIPIVIV